MSTSRSATTRINALERGQKSLDNKLDQILNMLAGEGEADDLDTQFMGDEAEAEVLSFEDVDVAELAPKLRTFKGGGVQTANQDSYYYRVSGVERGSEVQQIFSEISGQTHRRDSASPYAKYCGKAASKSWDIRIPAKMAIELGYPTPTSGRRSRSAKK